MYFPRQVFEPIPVRASRDVIETFAEDFAYRLNFRQGDGEVSVGGVNADVVRLIEKLGGRLFDGGNAHPKSQTEDDSLVIFARDDFVVQPFRNSLMWLDIEASQALTNAAEIGHLLLHYPLVQTTQNATDEMSVVMAAPRHAQGSIQELCDIEAYWFAYAVVFPKALFRKLWDHHHGNIGEIAYDQGVLVKHVENRAKRLGLVQADAA